MKLPGYLPFFTCQVSWRHAIFSRSVRMLQCRYEKPFNQWVKTAVFTQRVTHAWTVMQGRLHCPQYMSFIKPTQNYGIPCIYILHWENGPEIEKYNAKTCWNGFNVCTNWAFIKSREKRICMISKILEPIQEILRFKLSLPKSTVKKKTQKNRNFTQPFGMLFNRIQAKRVIVRFKTSREN